MLVDAFYYHKVELYPLYCDVVIFVDGMGRGRGLLFRSQRGWFQASRRDG
jgi:hypothetical protein